MDTKKEAVSMLKGYFDQNRNQTFVYYDRNGNQHNYQLFIKKIDGEYNNSLVPGDVGVLFTILNPDNYWMYNNSECCNAASQYIWRIVNSITDYNGVWVTIA